MLNDHVVSLNMIIVSDVSESPNLHEFENLTMRWLVVKFYVCIEILFMKGNG